MIAYNVRYLDGVELGPLRGG